MKIVQNTTPMKNIAILLLFLACNTLIIGHSSASISSSESLNSIHYTSSDPIEIDEEEWRYRFVTEKEGEALVKNEDIFIAILYFGGCKYRAFQIEGLANYE